jgi:hypothetical protein
VGSVGTGEGQEEGSGGPVQHYMWPSGGAFETSQGQ